VRSDPAHTDVAFIMVTAESKTDNVVAPRKAGVNNYIVKLFNAAMLKAKMDAIFSAAAM
jgi:two-component system, chemotaxis family, chemotaxis protein CheY